MVHFVANDETGEVRGVVVKNVIGQPGVGLRVVGFENILGAARDGVWFSVVKTERVKDLHPGHFGKIEQTVDVGLVRHFDRGAVAVLPPTRRLLIPSVRNNATSGLLFVLKK